MDGLIQIGALLEERDVIEMRSVADIVGKGQLLGEKLIALLVRVARVAGI